MRIRLQFAGIFFLLCLLAGYAGLSSLQLGIYVDDKVLHVLTFFLLTVVFYWIIDTNRRRTLNLTVVVCTLILGIGSEFLQGFLPNGREFDLYDIVANIVGSLGGLGLCSWYHKRMLERRRRGRRYDAVPGEDEEDLELGEAEPGAGVIAEDGHEEGIMSAAGNERTTTLEQEVDNWDENAVDAWDEEDGDGDIGAASTKPKAAEQNGRDLVDAKKRVD
ncbi:VanZ like family protein [Seiridium cupressi]